MYMDLDGFKAVNDQFGHEVGDQVLVEVAQRISGALRNGDTLARLAGDEFVAVCAGPISPEVARRIGERVQRSVASMTDVGGRAVTLGVSVGIALAPTVIDDPEVSTGVLFRLADRAMYDSKRSAADEPVLAGLT